MLNLSQLCLSVCLFGTDKRQNGLSDQAQIFVGLHMTPGKVYGCLGLQKSVSKNVWFYLKFKFPRKLILLNSQILLLFLLFIEQKENTHHR